MSDSSGFPFIEHGSEEKGEGNICSPLDDRKQQ